MNPGRLLFLSIIASLVIVISSAAAQQHQLVQEFRHDHQFGIVGLKGSLDGKFLYSANYNSGILLAYTRDAQTGQIEISQKLGGNGRNRALNELNGLISINLSRDQQWAVGSSYTQKKVFLFQRNQQTGELTKVSEVVEGRDGVTGLGFPVICCFSPDSNFLYVANGHGSLTVFSVNNGELKFLQVHNGIIGDMKGSRKMSMHPNGNILFVSCCRSNAVIVFERDPVEGHVQIIDLIKDDTDRAKQIRGAMGSVCSPDGKFLYVVSGRFGGDEAVSVFSIGADAQWTSVQELVGGKEIPDFIGGNFITMSPDGEMVYASSAKSKTVAVFSRNIETGELTFVENLSANGSTDLGMCSDLFVSPDNRFLYVAGEAKNTIYVFER